MLTIVRRMLSKLISPLWRTAEVEEDTFSCATAMEEIRHLRGSVVTQLCLDYGMIDDAVYFSSSEVLGGVPLREGDTVNCIAVRDGAQRGWKALRVEKNADAWEDGGKTSLEADNKQLRPLIGTVTAVDANGGFINQTTFFQCHSLCEGHSGSSPKIHQPLSLSPSQMMFGYRMNKEVDRNSVDRGLAVSFLFCFWGIQRKARHQLDLQEVLICP